MHTHTKIVVWTQKSFSSSWPYHSESNFIACWSLLSLLSTTGLIQKTLKLIKYFHLESEPASFSFTSHLWHPKGSSLLLLFGSGTRERREEKWRRGRRDKVKFPGKLCRLCKIHVLMSVQIKPVILHTNCQIYTVWFEEKLLVKHHSLGLAFW